MLSTQTYSFLFIMKLQLQLQFYLKTHKETNTEKRDKYRHLWCMSSLANSNPDLEIGIYEMFSSIAVYNVSMSRRQGHGKLTVQM